MITVSDRSRAAVSALAELARRAEPAPVPILEIAEGCHIPLHVLEQLFSSLRRSGILKSQRGVKGGYSFLRNPRVEHDLQEYVAKFFLQADQVARLDRIERLVRLLDQVVRKRLMRLLGIPRTATRRPQPVHDRPQAVELFFRFRAGDHLLVGHHRSYF